MKFKLKDHLADTSLDKELFMTLYQHNREGGGLAYLDSLAGHTQSYHLCHN